jgi:hypothetical protein
MLPAITDPTVNTVFLEHTPYRMDQEYVESLIIDYHIGGVILFGNPYSTTLLCLRHLACCAPMKMNMRLTMQSSTFYLAHRLLAVICRFKRRPLPFDTFLFHKKTQGERVGRVS